MEEGEKERTEEEKTARVPIVVELGGKQYEIAPLVIRDSREWRKKYAEATAPLFQMVNIKVDETDAFGDILKKMLVVMPDQVIDLFFDYAKALNREEIESIATDAEIASAFEEVVKLALPLAESLPKAMGRFSQSAGPSSS